MTPRTFLKIVLERCPAYKQPLPDCALKEIRGEASDSLGRMERLAALSDDAVDQNIRMHFQCVCRKDGCGS